MQVFFSNHFLRSARKLRGREQDALTERVALLAVNPYDPRLHTKALSGELSGFFSFRVGRNIRVIFQFTDTETLMLVDIGNRKDIYR